MQTDFASANNAIASASEYLFNGRGEDTREVAMKITSSLSKGLVALAVLAPAVPASAAAAQLPDAQAGVRVDEQRVCKRLYYATGSYVRHEVCLTSEQWRVSERP